MPHGVARKILGTLQCSWVIQRQPPHGMISFDGNKHKELWKPQGEEEPELGHQEAFPEEAALVRAEGWVGTDKQ